MGLCRYVLLGWSFDIVNINSIFYEVIQQETKNNNKKKRDNMLPGGGVVWRGLLVFQIHAANYQYETITVICDIHGWTLPL